MHISGLWGILHYVISLVFLHFLDYLSELKAETLQMYFKKYTLTSTTVTLNSWNHTVSNCTKISVKSGNLYDFLLSNVGSSGCSIGNVCHPNLFCLLMIPNYVAGYQTSQIAYKMTWTAYSSGQGHGSLNLMLESAKLCIWEKTMTP